MKFYRKLWGNRRKDRSEENMKAVEKQLEHIAAEGGFKAALLASEDGFVVADIESELESEALAALAGFVWTANRNALDLTGFKDSDQLTLSSPSGDAVICRSFEVAGQPVVLTVIARIEPAYRGLTDRAMEGIKRILN